MSQELFAVRAETEKDAYLTDDFGNIRLFPTADAARRAFGASLGKDGTRADFVPHADMKGTFAFQVDPGEDSALVLAGRGNDREDAMETLRVDYPNAQIIPYEQAPDTLRPDSEYSTGEYTEP